MGNINLRVVVFTPEFWVSVTLKPCNLSQIESRLEGVRMYANYEGWGIRIEFALQAIEIKGIENVKFCCFCWKFMESVFLYFKMHNLIEI